MWEKKTIYLDLDDTVKDTERYIRRVLVSNGAKLASLTGRDSIYLLLHSDLYEGKVVRECLKEWDIIPFKSCAYNVIQLLKTEYNVVFCSAYTFEEEAECKRSFARSMGCDIILCDKSCSDKSHVDMSGAIFIDDRSDILAKSNADEKYELYSPYFFDIYAERDLKTKVVDWYSLASILMSRGIEKGGGLLEDFRGLLCSGVQA